jgi:raffinose/stachyose/melibiose transport system permease protein
LGGLSHFGAFVITLFVLVGGLALYARVAPRLFPPTIRRNALLDQTFRRFTYQGVIGKLFSHLILITWCLVVLIPFWTMLVNSIKDKREIFRAPFEFPEVVTFEGYQNAWVDGNFGVYFKNSLIVSIDSILLILLIGTLAAYGLSNWRSRKSTAIYFYFLAGLMIPIRLGTVNIIWIVQNLGLSGSLEGLILIYVAMGIPITIFIMMGFLRNIPYDLIEAARIDGASELGVFRFVIVPLLRPALATAAIFNFIPIYNDLWFPLILTRSENVRTVTYGVSLLFGQYQTDWNAILSTLSLASLPVLILYLLMSKQFIQGLTAGAVKG